MDLSQIGDITAQELHLSGLVSHVRESRTEQEVSEYKKELMHVLGHYKDRFGKIPNGFEIYLREFNIDF